MSRRCSLFLFYLKICPPFFFCFKTHLLCVTRFYYASLSRRKISNTARRFILRENFRRSRALILTVQNFPYRRPRSKILSSLSPVSNCWKKGNVKRASPIRIFPRPLSILLRVWLLPHVAGAGIVILFPVGSLFACFSWSAISVQGAQYIRCQTGLLASYLPTHFI